MICTINSEGKGTGMQTIWQNLRFALRMIRKDPGLSFTVLLTLALGIGANTAIFTVDYASLLAPLPFQHPEQLVILWSKVNGERTEVPARDFIEWKRDSTVFQDLQAWEGSEFNLATQDQPVYVQARLDTPGLNDMLGNRLFLGRDFVPEEGQPGKDHVAILTHKVWQRLGSNPHVIGSTIRLNDEPYTVVGVFEPGLTDRQGDLVVPLAFRPEQLTGNSFYSVWVMGRLKPGVTRQEAQIEMDSIAKQLAKEYPQTSKGSGVSVENFKNDFITSDRIRTLWLLLAAVGFVLLIACVNVANLLLAKSMTRQREVAVRTAVGARPSAIFGQLLTESLLLALMGGMLGILVGDLMLREIAAAIPPGILSSEADLTLNFPILLFALAATTIVGFGFGCAPAWYASRVDPGEALKDSGRTGTSLARHHLRRALVIAEFALALVLLAGAGLAIHSFSNLLRLDLGVRTDHILTFELPVPMTRSINPEKAIAYFREMLAKIRAIPGVTNAAAMTGVPLESGNASLPFSVVGDAGYSDPSKQRATPLRLVTPGYFETFSIRMLTGRPLRDEDTENAPKVVVVNEDFAKQYLRGRDPLQQRISLPQVTVGSPNMIGPPTNFQVVGVYHHVAGSNNGMSMLGLRDHFPEILLPFWQMPWSSGNIAVRTSQDPSSMLTTVSAAVHVVDPTVAVAQPETMEQVRDDALVQDRLTTFLFVSFALIALLLSAVGIYGVIAFSVNQRTHEIAVRMAVGATRDRVIALVLREGAILASIGTALGLIGAYSVGRLMGGILYGVHALDMTAFTLVSLLLLSAALLACYVPAQRAASVEPMQALRTE